MAMPGENRADARNRPLTLGTRLAYAAGAGIDGATSNGLNLFQMFYVTAVCGLPGTLAGLALSLGLIVDAVMDPLIGSLSDGWRSRWGRRLPFMVVGGPASALMFVAVFSLPAGWSNGALFVWLAACSILLRIALSVFNLPFFALGAELSDDYAERSRIVAWRWGMGMFVGLWAVVIGFGGFFSGPKGTLDRAGYTPFAASCAVLILGGTLFSAMAALRVRDRTHRSRVDQVSGLRGFVSGLSEVSRNPTFRILFVSALMLFTAQGITLALSLHANTYFWHLTPTQTRNVTLMLLVGLLVGAPVLGVVAPRFEKRSMMMVSIMMLAITEAVPITLRLLGLFPLEGTALGVALSVTTGVMGFAITGIAIALFSMLADAADEHDFLFGGRREGLYFAGWTFASKAAAGLGSLIGGIVLNLSGFPRGAAIGMAAVSPGTAASIAFWGGPGAAVLTFASVAVLLGYGLDRRRHAEILAALAHRRATMPA
jgi:glycoside/pentoside/hexuronide:cation symporter, GPH family